MEQIKRERKPKAQKPAKITKEQVGSAIDALAANVQSTPQPPHEGPGDVATDKGRPAKVWSYDDFETAILSMSARIADSDVPDITKGQLRAGLRQCMVALGKYGI